MLCDALGCAPYRNQTHVGSAFMGPFPVMHPALHVIPGRHGHYIV